MRMSEGNSNENLAARTVQRAKIRDQSGVEYGPARFWFIESATVHCCGTHGLGGNPFCGKADMQRVLHVGLE
jgi:hypothetical protein